MIKAFISAYLPYVLAAAFVIGLAGGFSAAWVIQGGRIDTVKADLSKARGQLAECQEANKTNANTIAALRADLKASNSNCVARVEIRDHLVTEIQRIDALQESKTDEKGTLIDSLLIELNRMYPAASSADRVRKAGDSADSSRSDFLPGAMVENGGRVLLERAGRQGALEKRDDTQGARGRPENDIARPGGGGCRTDRT